MNTTSLKFKLGFIALALSALTAAFALAAVKPQHRPVERLVSVPAPSTSSVQLPPAVAPTTTTAAPKLAPAVSIVRHRVTTTTSTTAHPRSPELEARIPDPTDDLDDFGGIYCPDVCEDIDASAQ